MTECKIIDNESLYVNFYARLNWPECANVRDQFNYDSCWAQCSTEALNDKTHIKS